MDQRRDAQPWCQGSSSLCVVEVGGGCVDQQRSRVTTARMNSGWEGPTGLAPTQVFVRGGPPFSGCDGPGGSLIQTELSQGGKLSLPG